MKKLTLEMLAKTAGVGVANVDRGLNERGGVSPETTRKVLKAARENGFKAVITRRVQASLADRSFPERQYLLFFTQLAKGFSHIASGLGYRLTLHRTFIPESQPEKLAQYIIESSEKRNGTIVFAHI